MSFENLKMKFGIPQTHLFKYFQIRSFIHARVRSYQCPPLSVIEDLVTSDSYMKGMISVIYKNLVNPCRSMGAPARRDDISTSKRCRIMMTSPTFRNAIAIVRGDVVVDIQSWFEDNRPLFHWFTSILIWYKSVSELQSEQGASRWVVSAMSAWFPDMIVGRVTLPPWSSWSSGAWRRGAGWLYPKMSACSRTPGG